MESAGPDVTEPGEQAEPLVLPLAPRRGWSGAGDARRAFAVAWVVALVGVALSALSSRRVDDADGRSAVSVMFAFFVLLAGPPLSYSAARVLRPHPGRSAERVARHWAAAVATPYGLAVLGLLGAYGDDTSRLWLFAGAPGAVTVLEVVAASVLGPVSLAWGLVALLWRAAERWPSRLGWVRAAGLRTLGDDEDRVVGAGDRST